MERPQLIKLRAAVAAGKFSRVWVWRIDRLSRSGIVETISCIQEFRRAGCIVASVSDPFPLEGPGSEIVLACLAYCAQMEREKIRENQLAARARMEAEGRGWGHPRLPEELRAQALALAAAGLSFRKIARELKISKSSAWNFLRRTPTSEIENLTDRPPQKTRHSRKSEGASI